MIVASHLLQNPSDKYSAQGRVLNLVQRTDGKWYVSLHGEEDSRESLSLSELLKLVKTLMLMSNDQFRQEQSQRVQIGKLIQAHKHSSHHYDEIMSSKLCGCFYCLAIFPPEQINTWWGRNKAKTYAVCPHCQIDSVIGSASGYPITIEFLDQMRQRWF